MPGSVNETMNVFIPKINQPDELKDFRPIRLCNVIYKVVAKCTANMQRQELEKNRGGCDIKYGENSEVIRDP